MMLLVCSTTAEFLKVTVSRSCDHAKIFRLCAKSGDLDAQTKNLCILTSFYTFSSFFTHIKWFFVIFFKLFLAQNFKNQVLTAQKILLLECLYNWFECIVEKGSCCIWTVYCADIYYGCNQATIQAGNTKVLPEFRIHYSLM